MIRFSFKGERCELCELLRCLCARPPAAAAVQRVVTYRVGGVSFTAKGNQMSLTVRVTEVPGTADVSVAFTDSEGNPASLDAPPQWSATDPNVIDSITAAADGLSAKVHLTNNIGSSQLTLDGMEEGQPVQFVDVVNIVEGTATAANFTFGAVTPD